MRLNISVLVITMSIAGCKSTQHKSELLSDRKSDTQTFHCRMDPKYPSKNWFTGEERKRDELTISFSKPDTLVISGDYKGSKGRFNKIEVPLAKGLFNRIHNRMWGKPEYLLLDESSGNFTQVLFYSSPASGQKFKIAVSNAPIEENDGSGGGGEEPQLFDCE